MEEGTASHVFESHFLMPASAAYQAAPEGTDFGAEMKIQRNREKIRSLTPSFINSRIPAIESTSQGGKKIHASLLGAKSPVLLEIGERSLSQKSSSSVRENLSLKNFL